MVDVSKYVAEKIKYYRKLKGLTQKELGDIVGVQHNTISSYESGTNEPEQNMIFKIADALNIKIDDLFPSTQMNNVVSSTELIPILGKVNAGTPNFAIEEVLGYMTAPPKKQVKPTMFYLEVASDSMDKQFPVGSYVLVDPEVQILSGDAVVVKINGEDATLKQIKVDLEKNKLYLFPNSNNPSYMPEILDLHNNDITFSGKVIGVYQSI